MSPHSELEPAPSAHQTHSPAGLTEWLDKRRWICHAALALVPFVVVLPLCIFHLSLNPIWYFSGVVQNTTPGILPAGMPVSDPNVSWTTQALGHLAAWQWIHGKVPWWNSYSGIGLPLAGEMQPGAFFLPFILLLLLHNGFLWLRIAMQLVAGFSTFALLRELKLGRLAALMGGVLFELNGTFAFTPGPASVFCSAAFLPLLLLGIEQIARRESSRSGILWVALGLAFSLLAGFPEVAYINGLLALLWCICRFAMLRKRRHFAVRLAWGGLLGLLLSAPLLTGFWSLLKQSSAFQNHPAGLASLPLTAIPSIFIPYIFGPFLAALPGPGNFDVWGASSYAGILLFFFSVLGLFAKKPLWLRALLIGWVALCGAKIFGLQPLTAIVNHIPFLLQTIFSRYSPSSWTLCLIILAAFAIDELRHRELRLRIPAILALSVFVVSICIAWPWRSIWNSQPVQAAAMGVYVLYAAGWSLGGLICAILILRFWRGENGRAVLSALLALNFGVFFSIPLLSAFHPGSVDRAAIRFLHANLGRSRFYTLGPIQPNYGAYFRAASINYVSFPLPERFYRYMMQHVFPALPKSVAIGAFWPGGPWFDPGSGLTYLNELLPEYQKLGVKYVVADARAMDSLSPQVEIPTATQGNMPLPLLPDQYVQLTVSIPTAPVGANSSIRGVSVLLGNYGNTSDGDLSIRLCAGETCVSGTRPLSDSEDNSLFYVPLAGALPVAAGSPATVTVSHAGGSKPAALWIWPALPGSVQRLRGTDGKLLAGKSLRLSFAYSAPSSALPRVYHDALINIFELQNPVPYYRIASGGPCRLDAINRDSMRATCSAPARLVRSELYMPGWRASLNRKRIEVNPYEEIFQSFNLPSGESFLRLSYVPPLERPAQLGVLFAAVALLLELVFAIRQSRLRTVKERPL